MNKPFSLYIHIPFCKQKCSYCDFVSFAKSSSTQSSYVDSLLRDLELWRSYLKEKKLSSIFIGGGTPSILEPKELHRLLSKLSTLNMADDCEFSIESNPESTTAEKLSIMKEYGVNRVSFGLQSTHSQELKLLRRVHDYSTFLRAYENAINTGFSNINIDLMFALPMQTLEHHLSSLEKISLLSPTHIAVYSLIVEENTLMERWVKENKFPLPSEEEYVNMYRQSIHYLKGMGYQHYEISNFSKPGYECRHNKAYWNRSEYLGLGISAASFLNNRRYTVPDDLNSYIKEAPWTPEMLSNIDELSLEESFEETIFLGLRLNKGLSLASLQQSFPKFITESFYSTLHSLEKRNLVATKKDGIITLTQKGIEVSNQVFLELLL